MSAPDGFNSQASMLPDPGAAAAPIHVMRGGGTAIQSGGVTAQFSMEEKNILEQYGLDNENITQHIEEFDDEFKRAFLRQIKSKECEQKGNSITKKDCWAVAAVIKANVKEQINIANQKPLFGRVPEHVPEGTPRKVPGAGPEIDLSDIHREDVRHITNTEENTDADLAPCVRDEITELDTEGDMTSNSELNTLDQNIQWITDTLHTDKLENEATALLNPSNGNTTIFPAYKAYMNEANQQALDEINTNTIQRDIVRRVLGLLSATKVPKDKQTPELIRKHYVNIILTDKHKKYIDDHNLNDVIMNSSTGTASTASVPAPVAAAPPVPAPPSIVPPILAVNSSDSYTRMAAPDNAFTRALAEEAARGVSLDDVLLEDEVVAAAATPAAANNASYFEENPANFRKGQYGINLNRNNSKRFYANALVGTKRMRIRGRNAGNIKTRYNRKKELLRQERLRLEQEHTAAQQAANTAAAAARAERQRLVNTVATTRRAANIAAAEKKIRNRSEKAAEAARVKAAKERAAGIRRAGIAEGTIKPSFMNRMRSIKNPFKRGGSSRRKTRRNTRRNRSNRRR